MRTKILIALFVLTISFPGVHGQSFTLDDIIQGNIATYKKYDIKKLTFKNNDEILKSISIHPDSNKLSITNPTSSYDYYFDEKYRPIFIIKENEKFSIEYSKENSNIKSQSLTVTDSIYEKRYSTTFSNTDYIDIESNLWFTVNKVIFDTIDKKETNWVINKKDYLLSFIERVTSDRKLREYVNGTRVETAFQEKFVEYDSIVPQLNEISHKYNYKTYSDEQQITIQTDSTYISTIKSGELVYARTEKDDLIYNEYFYEKDSIISKSIAYTYFPDTYGDLILWEVSTKEMNQKHPRKKYPNKKFYRLKDNKLISKTRFQYSRVVGCGMAIERKRPSFLESYRLFSSSILTTESFTRSMLRSLPFEIDENEMALYYNQIKLLAQQNGKQDLLYKTSRKDLDRRILLTSEQRVSVYKAILGLFNNSKEMNERNYKIEVVTNRGETFIFHPFIDDKSIPLEIDIFVVNDFRYR